MKEAVSEANLTVVAIILIAVILAAVRPLFNSMLLSTAWKTCCADAGGVIVDGDTCRLPNGGDHAASSVYSKKERRCKFSY